MINTNYHSIGLIIWRSLVSSLRSEGLPSVNKSQAQAGPRFYYSDLRFGIGRCFWVMVKIKEHYIYVDTYKYNTISASFKRVWLNSW